MVGFPKPEFTVKIGSKFEMDTPTAGATFRGIIRHIDKRFIGVEITEIIDITIH
jgi:hypothetical protein